MWKPPTHLKDVSGFYSIPAAPLCRLVLCFCQVHWQDTVKTIISGNPVVSGQGKTNMKVSNIAADWKHHFFFLSNLYINAQTFCSYYRLRSVGSLSVSGCDLLVYITYWRTHSPAVCLSYAISSVGAIQCMWPCLVPQDKLWILQWQLCNKLLYREQVMVAITLVIRPSLSLCPALSQLQLRSLRGSVQGPELLF